MHHSPAGLLPPQIDSKLEIKHVLHQRRQTDGVPTEKTHEVAATSCCMAPAPETC